MLILINIVFLDDGKNGGFEMHLGYSPRGGTTLLIERKEILGIILMTKRSQKLKRKSSRGNI